jgi:hypothetical protein
VGSALPRAKPTGLEQSPKGEATDLIDFVLAFIFLLPFSAQKSHVKSQNHLTPSNPLTSELQVSFTPSAIIEIVGKKAESPAERSGLFPLRSRK